MNLLYIIIFQVKSGAFEIYKKLEFWKFYTGYGQQVWSQYTYTL